MGGGAIAPRSHRNVEQEGRHPRMTDQCRGTICEILVECIMRNNSVKLFSIWVSGSGVTCRLKVFLSGALAVLQFGAAEPFMQS